MDVSLAIDLLKKGGVVAFPTDTVYGIGCDIFNLSAIKRIYEIKKRDASKPLAAHVGSIEQIKMVAITNVQYFDVLCQKFLPGPLAIVLPKLQTVSNIVTSGMDTISIRFPDCSEAIDLALGLGNPIAATSANLSGMPSAVHHIEVINYFKDSVDFVIKAGTTKFKKESTIVDLTQTPPKILREGVISKIEIEQILRKCS